MRGRGLSRGSSETRSHSNGSVQLPQQPELPLMGDLLGLDNSPVASPTSPVVGNILDLYAASRPRRRDRKYVYELPQTPERDLAPIMAPRTPDNDDDIFEERLINFD